MSKEKVYKLYCVFSKEAVKAMNGARGKLAAQAGHGYLHSFWDSEERFPEAAKAYKVSMKAYKICLVVDEEKDLYPLLSSYKNTCGVSLVKDAGLTVFDGPTVTCLGIGPIEVGDIKEDLSSLKVL